MKIMVIGAKSAGKSTFSEKLGKKLSLPVVHIDTLVNNAGRYNNKVVEALIKSEADKPDWIIDGNSFTRDRKYRLEKADYVIVFTISPFKSFFSHVQRWLKEKTGDMGDRYGRSEELHLGFAIAFAFWRWPKREKEILWDIKDLNKKVFFIRNYKEVDLFLERASVVLK